VSDIDTAVVDSLKVLDPNRPIREADIGPLVQVENVKLTRCLDSRLVTIVVRVARNRIPSQLSFLWMLVD
jgi:hypothetical protein